jgi:hypothetical protein
MQTRIDFSLVEKCVSGFPDGDGWAKMDLPLKKEKGAGLSWANVKMTLPPKPAVYAFFLPTEFFATETMITLDAKHEKRVPTKIAFWFTPPKIKVDGRNLSLVYVGKTTNILKRKQMHFRKSTPTARQVHAAIEKLIDNCAHEEAPRFGKLNALGVMAEHAAVRYYVIDDLRDQGISHAATRDLIELQLIGRFAPPFNIKAER